MKSICIHASVAALVTVVACVMSWGQSDIPATTNVLAVCIRHIGDIDKPIYPIIIAANAQSESACRVITDEEGGFLHDFTRLARPSNAKLTAIINRIEKTAAPMQGKPKCSEFGTFRWTILHADQKTQWETCQEQSIQLMSDLLKISDNNELNDALRSTLLRFGIRKT